MNLLLDVDSVTAGYGKTPVIRDLSLEVGEGEAVGLLGANGAGKTTSLGVIAGTLPAWSGSIRVVRRDVTGASSWDRVDAGCALVPEGRRVFGAMSVGDNLDVAGLRAPSAGEQRDEVFDLFPRLAERRDQVAGSLSGGEQQMLAIGRALMTAPRLLLVDEMSAGLAPLIAEQLVEGLAEIHSRGVGILVVEQNPRLVTSLVDRVYLLEQGRIARTGTLEELGGAGEIADLYLGIARTTG